MKENIVVIHKIQNEICSKTIQTSKQLANQTDDFLKVTTTVRAAQLLRGRKRVQEKVL